MNFTRLSLQDLGALQSVELDLTTLPEGITAVTGENGAGKSTLLGSLLAAIYRDVPGRGSLIDLAQSRETRVEASVTADGGSADYSFRQLADCVSRKSESVVLDCFSQPLTDGKASSADAWVAESMPPIEVVLCSLFGRQKSDGFLGMKPAERKALILDLLGVGELEVKASKARENARDTKGKLEVVRARLGDEQRRGGSVLATTEARHQAADQAHEADIARHQAVAYLRDIEQEAFAAAERNRARVAIENQRATLQRSLNGASGTLVELGRRKGECEGLVWQSESIRAATARVPQLERELADAERLLDAVTRARKEAGKYDVFGLSKVAAFLPHLVEELTDAEKRLEAARGDLEQVTAARLLGAEGRIEKLRDALEGVIECEAGEEVAIATEALQTDDAAVALAADLPGLRERAKSAVSNAEFTAKKLALKLDNAKQAAAQLELYEKAKAELDAATEAALRYQGDGVDDLREEFASLQPLAAQADRLTRAETTLAELDIQIAATKETISDLTRQFEAIPVPGELVPVPDLAPSRARVTECEAAVSRTALALSRAEDALKAAQEAEGRVSALVAEQAQLEADLGDWTRLGADLGKDGLQAMLVDSALPELSALTNELLHGAFGPRWSVDFRTQQLDSKGKRQLETLDVVVLDSERGREASADTLSGGERVVVGEAVALALTVLVNRRYGFSGVTLVRDESGAALDPERAASYVGMLRRGMKMVGASQCLMVSHSEQVQELCDGRILVANGTVEVMR